ncbi:hypothetical protein FRC03_003092 [Tulasnella sp. 419]|nr:hypothetical protein FRC02_000713 [Tulasnella sp. 418]KAG8969401.1 hypothetical protein FRC03_003092 [Tulasnella sp. 419]
MELNPDPLPKSDLIGFQFDQLIPHPKYYFDDGNFIFIVESTKFRLYKGLLARQSAVMAGMFAMPEPVGTPSASNFEMMVDGVVTVQLQDSANDFACLLDFLFAINTPPYPPTPPPFEDLVSVLRLSRKYMFDEARERALWHLFETLPSSLDDFIDNPSLTMFTGIRAAQVVSMAREFELSEFIPLALYAIAAYNWKPTELGAADQVFSALPPPDRARVIVGRNAMYAEALRIASSMHEHGMVGGSCNNPITLARVCAKGKPSHLWMNPTEALQEFLRNPMRQLVIRKNCEFHALCKSCVESLRTRMGLDLEELYAKLPDIFQLRSDTEPNDTCIEGMM